MGQQAPKPSPDTPPPNSGASEKRPQQQDLPERQQLQKAIDASANDRAALVRNLEEFLKKYPQSSQRPQIYRALVESSLQLRDFPRAVDYSERLVSLNPERYLQYRSHDSASQPLRGRARVSPGGFLLQPGSGLCRSHASIRQVSPRVSRRLGNIEEDEISLPCFSVRGGLYQKLNDNTNAQKDFEASYTLIPNAAVGGKAWRPWQNRTRT